MRSSLGISEQAQEVLRVRNSGRLESVRVGDCVCLPCCYSWASVGATGSLSPAGLQLEEGSFLHSLAACQACPLLAPACGWEQRKDSQAMYTLFEDLRAGAQVQPPMTACQGAFSCPP